MKKYFAGLIAFIIAVSAAAFTAPEQLANQTWKYNSGSVTNENSYTPGDPGCAGNANICKIVAPEDPANPGHPQISSSLANRIMNKDVSAGDVFLKN